ncbi:hypothetical protein BOQ62_06295 [Chryseobacterium sp. CH21]|nr:hypothetical protein BOQ62_06295 [Chryseobacterium sp. CH21]
MKSDYIIQKITIKKPINNLRINLTKQPRKQQNQRSKHHSNSKKNTKMIQYYKLAHNYSSIKKI